MRTLILLVLCCLGFGAQVNGTPKTPIVSFGTLSGPGIPDSLAFQLSDGVYAIRMMEGKEPELQFWPAKDWVEYNEGRTVFHPIGEDNAGWGAHDRGVAMQPTTKGFVRYTPHWNGQKETAALAAYEIWWGTHTNFSTGKIQPVLYLETSSGEFVVTRIDGMRFPADAVVVRRESPRENLRSTGTLGGGWKYLAGEAGGVVIRALEVVGINRVLVSGNQYQIQARVFATAAEVIEALKAGKVSEVEIWRGPDSKPSLERPLEQALSEAGIRWYLEVGR